MTTPIELTRCPGHRGQPACQSCARYLKHGETLTAGTPTFLSTGELQRTNGGQTSCMAFLAPGALSALFSAVGLTVALPDDEIASKGNF